MTTTTQARPAAATPRCVARASVSLRKLSDKEFLAWQAQGLQFPFLATGALGEVLLLCSQAGDISLKGAVGLKGVSEWPHLGESLQALACRTHPNYKAERLK